MNYFFLSFIDLYLYHGQAASKMKEQKISMDKGGELPKTFYHYLFLNPTSGNMVGLELLKCETSEIKFSHFGKTVNSVFRIINFTEEEERTVAFEQITKLSKDQLVRIIIGGGDGSVQWVLEEAISEGLPFANIIFGMLSIGTGNDFAKSLGWERFNFSGKLSQLKNLSQKFILAELGNYDIWLASVQCHESGSIHQMKRGREKELKTNTLTRHFTNYFGIGTDARITYLASQMQTKAESVVAKKLAYGLAGFMSFCLQWGGLSEKMKSFKSYNSESLLLLDQNSTNPEEGGMLMEELLTEEVKERLQREKKHLKIDRKDQCITFINSTKSMELEHIWKTPHQTGAREQNGEEFYQSQNFEDGMIEIVSYHNQISLMLERTMHMAKKVGQGPGPFKIQFNCPSNKKKQTTFIQVNGEPYRVINLRKIFIRKSELFPFSKIQVLKPHKSKNL